MTVLSFSYFLDLSLTPSSLSPSQIHAYKHTLSLYPLFETTVACQVCHIPYSRHESPFPMSFVKCAQCKKRHVPEMLLTTIEPPSELDTLEGGKLIEAHGTVSLHFSLFLSPIKSLCMNF